MHHAPLRCRCGTVQGHVERPRAAARALCYCKDCQSFARFLGHPETTLDDAGGTHVVATRPQYVRFTAGVERLACMSLSPKGLLRWYAACCRTAVGNTPRDPKFPYVGLVHECLAADDAELGATFGTTTVAVNTASATRAVRSTPLAALFGVLGIARGVLAARIGGGWRDNPFFRPGTAQPIAAPEVLSLAQRQALRQ